MSSVFQSSPGKNIEIREDRLKQQFSIVLVSLYPLTTLKIIEGFKELLFMWIMPMDIYYIKIKRFKNIHLFIKKSQTHYMSH